MLCVQSKEATQRSMLEGGHLVVRLQKTIAQRPASGWEALAATMLGEDARQTAEWAEGPELWLQNCSALLQAIQANISASALLAHHGGPHDSPGAEGEFAVWKELDLDAQWSFKLFAIQSPETPVAFLQPRLCYVKEWLAKECSLWPPPPEGKKIGQQGQRQEVKRESSSSGPWCTSSSPAT